jgi:hypothetical protein
VKIEAIRGFKGDFSGMTEADRFFAEVCVSFIPFSHHSETGRVTVWRTQVVKVPNLSVRLNSFLFKQQFRSQVEFVRDVRMLSARCAGV